MGPVAGRALGRLLVVPLREGLTVGALGPLGELIGGHIRAAPGSGSEWHVAQVSAIRTGFTGLLGSVSGKMA